MRILIARASHCVAVGLTSVKSARVVTKKNLDLSPMVLSDAQDALVRAMCGGLRRPKPVDDVKKDVKFWGRNLSVGFGPWIEDAGRCLRDAALKGKLPIYCAAPERKSPLMRLSPHLLKRLIAPRGSFPDHPVRAGLELVRQGLASQSLLTLLNRGTLVVRRLEFTSWLGRERRKGIWPSQRKRGAPRKGRPSKMRESARNTIDALVNSGDWTVDDGVSKLHRIISVRGGIVPSHDTLLRLVADRFRETGDPAYQLPSRRRRRS